MSNYIKLINFIFVTILSFIVSIGNVSAQCTAVIGINNVAQIAGDTVSGCDPFNILFTDKTTGATSTRLWNFGDGTGTSSSNNVTHLFPAGKKTDTIYTVTLTSTCIPSGTNSTTLRVKVLRKPNVDFSANKLTVCQQTDLITFNNLSENKAGYGHAWDFAGEGASALVSPTFTFQNDGLKTIKLTVTDDRGCFKSVSKTDYINVVKLPSPDFSVDIQSGCNPMKVNFGNTTTDANITSWTWDFGDASAKVNSKTLSSPHTYTTPGLIFATLTAVNSLGCSNTTNKSIVNQFTPSAKFTVPSPVCKNSESTLTYSGTANISTKYSWTFDTDISVLSGSKSGPYNLKFNKATVQNIKLITQDTISGCSDTLTKSVEVKEVPELKLSSSNGDTICKASLVTFTATPAIYSNYVFKINKVQVQSSADNTYIAPLTLKNKDTVSVEIDNGCGGVENIPVIITVKELPEVTLKSSRDTIYKKTVVTFTAIPKDTAGYDRYDFYEGNVLKQSDTSNVWVTDSLVDGKLVNVIAFNNGCTGNVSNKVVKVIDPFDSPDVTAKTTTSSVTINWTKVLNELGKSPDGYQISINGGPFIDPSSGYGPNATSHVITGLNPGDSIRVTVRTLATKLNNADTLGNSTINQTYTFVARDCDPVSFLVGPDLSVCKGESATLTVKSVSAAKYSVNWAGLANSQLNAYIFVPTNSFSAKISIIDSSQTNCPFEKFTQIEVKEKPSIQLSVSPQGELIKGDFVTYTATPGSYDTYTFFNKGLQVQKSSVNTFSTKNYANGDIITANAELNGCLSDISNAIILKINTSVDPVQINLDSSTTTSVAIDWQPVEGATGYLVSVNGQTFVVPNGISVNNLIKHQITGLTAGQKVDVVVKSFNETDTTLSSVFTAYALECRTLNVDLAGTPIICSGDSAYVSITNTLPSYIGIKWQNGVLGANKTYKFLPLTNSTIKLELIDSERAGCNVTRNYDVVVDYSSNCNKTDFTELDQAQINLDTATTQSVTIHWNTVKDATGYLVSVNGKTYVVPNGTNDGTQLTHIISGLSPSEVVNVVVKSFNSTDTSISTVFTTAALSCRGVDVNLVGTSSVCSSDSAVVKINNVLPSYFQTKWQDGSIGTTQIYKLKPAVTTDVKLEVIDSERSGCSVIRYFTVSIDNSSNCDTSSNTVIVIKDKLIAPDLSIDTATNNSVKIAWTPVVGATGYLISVDGKEFSTFQGSMLPDDNGKLTYTQTGLIPNQTLTFVVKAFNGTDTVTSVIINGVATNCSSLSYTLEASSPICIGDSALVSITSVLPANYQVKWMTDAVGTSRSYHFKPATSTLVNVTVTNPSEPLCGLTKKILVKVNPIPVVTLTSSDANDTIYKGTPISFTANPSGLDGYEFYERFSLVQNSNLSVYNTNTLEDNRTITVIGVKDGCRSAASNAINTKVKDPLGNIQISGTSTNNSITVTWDKVPDAVKYEVSVNGGPFTTPSSGGTPNDTSHTVTGLNPEEQTTIVVKAYTSDPNEGGSTTSDPWVQTTIVCNAITFKVSSDTTVCEGSTATLKLLKTNVAKYSLRWNYNLPTKSNTYSFEPSQTLNVPVQLIDSAQINCPYYRNIEVDVNERNALSLLATDTSYQICQGTAFTVNAQPSDLDNYVFKRVSKSGTVTLQNSGNPKLLVTTYSSGDTILVQGTANSCSALNDARYAKIVNPIPSSIIDAPVSNNACQGQDVIYSAVPLKHIAKYSYFENGLLAQSSGSNSYIKTNVQPGTLPAVTLVVKDTKTGCTSLLSAPKVVTILPYTTVSASSNLASNIVCEGSAIKFTVTPNTLTKYKFYVNDTLSQDSIINTFTKNNLKTGDKVNVIGVNSNNCESPTIADMLVTVKPIAKPTIVADTMDVCDGVLAKIKATLPTGVSPTIIWNTGEVKDSLYKVYTADLWQKITSTLNGCSSSDSVFIKVDKATPSVATILIDGVPVKNNISVVCRDDSKTFKASGSTLKKYTWLDNNGLILGTDSTINLAPTATTFYKMIASNKACADTTSLELNIVACGQTAQIFTPGTDGKNDKWIALDPEEYFKDNTVTIFNRWGNEVFTATNYKNDWDGSNSSGDKLPEGTYYYVIKVQGQVEAKVGFVIIKR